MLDTIKQTCRGYYDELPTGTVPAIAKSAFYSFVVVSLFIDKTKPYDIVQPLVKAGVAVLATCIYSLTAPFFNLIFGDNRHLWHRELLKLFVLIPATAIAYQGLTTGKVALTALPRIATIPWNYILASLDLIPTLGEILDPQTGQEIRKVYAWLGVNIVPGSASLILTS